MHNNGKTLNMLFDWLKGEGRKELGSFSRAVILKVIDIFSIFSLF